MPKKALIITHNFCPLNTPGTHRMFGFAKHLPKFGWEPTVLSPDFVPENTPKYYDPNLVGCDVCRVIRVPFSKGSVRQRINKMESSRLKVLSFYKYLLWSPLRHQHNMLAKAKSLIQTECFDLILATTPPVYPFGIADEISRKYRIPWIGDYRDIPGEHVPQIKYLSAHWVNLRWHLKYNSSAAASITVSAPLQEQLLCRQNKPVHIIYNGYEPDCYLSDCPPNSDVFDLVYCGSIHGSRNPSLLLEALDRILEEDAEILDGFRVSIYGISESAFALHFGNRPCTPLIRYGGRVSWQECIKMQQQAQALLLLPNPGATGLLTSKVFEYLGARRPILSVPGDKSVTDTLLGETQAGRVGRTAREIITIIIDWLQQWRRTGSVNYQANTDIIQTFSREKQTEKLARIFDEIVDARKV
jgi:glycosyltransferase involved in cell wall biosynthesis